MSIFNNKYINFKGFYLIFLLIAFSSCFQAAPGEASSAGSVASEQGGSAAPQSTNAPKAFEQEFPQAMDWVNDFADFLSDEEVALLSQKINAYEQQTGVEVAIVTVNSYPKEQSFMVWLTDLANYWGVGKETTNNGILIGLSKQERKSGIVTGLGMENKLSNAKSQSILNNVMRPKLKQGKYYEAYNESLDAIFEELAEN